MTNCSVSLAGIDRGLAAVQETQEEIRQQIQDVIRVAETLASDKGTMAERHDQFRALQNNFARHTDPTHEHMARVMKSFEPGLFVGVDGDGPQDNLDSGTLVSKAQRARTAHSRPSTRRSTYCARRCDIGSGIGCSCKSARRIHTRGIAAIPSGSFTEQPEASNSAPKSHAQSTFEKETIGIACGIGTAVS